MFFVFLREFTAEQSHSPGPSFTLPKKQSRLSDHQAGHAQFGRADAVVVTEGTAALAHDHGLEPARAFEGHLLGGAVGERLDAERRALAATASDAAVPGAGARPQVEHAVGDAPREAAPIHHRHVGRVAEPGSSPAHHDSTAASTTTQHTPNPSACALLQLGQLAVQLEGERGRRGGGRRARGG